MDDQYYRNHLVTYGNKAPRHGDRVAILDIAFQSHSVTFIANMILRPVYESGRNGMSKIESVMHYSQ